MRLISVVLGTQSFKAREDASAALLNYGFTFYETVKAKGAGDVVLKPEVYKGEERSRHARAGARRVGHRRARLGGAAQDHGHGERTRGRAHQGGPGAGRAHGVSDGKDVIARVPLVAKEAVPEGGWWTRMVDGIALWME